MSAADDVKRAWTDRGSHPGYHREQQARLRREWPVLQSAIVKLVRETPSSVGITEEPTTKHEIADLLLEHHRDNIQGCRCGWGMDGTKLGHSHAEHVAEEILRALR